MRSVLVWGGKLPMFCMAVCILVVWAWKKCLKCLGGSRSRQASHGSGSHHSQACRCCMCGCRMSHVQFSIFSASLQSPTSLLARLVLPYWSEGIKVSLFMPFLLLLFVIGYFLPQERKGLLIWILEVSRRLSCLYERLLLSSTHASYLTGRFGIDNWDFSVIDILYS